MTGSIEIPFAIGSTVWKVGAERVEVTVPCPDCIGEKTVKIVFPSGEEAVIGCQTCTIAYDPPRGTIMVYTWEVLPEPFLCRRVVGVRGGDVDYTEAHENHGSYSFVSSKELYATEEEALAACAVERERRDRQDKDTAVRRLQSSRKDMAYSVSSWRKTVKKLERDLETARARLGISLEKAKAEKRVKDR